MNVDEAIAERRSIRRYRSDPIPDEIVQRLLEAARLAPSSSNLQSWKFKLVSDFETRKRLREMAFNQRFIEMAPLVIVCCADLFAFKERMRRSFELITEGKVRPNLEMMMRMAVRAGRGEDREAYQIISAAINVAIAVENIVLEATELGLGTCWVRAFEQDSVAEFLKLPLEVIPIVLLPVGYPAESPAQRPRKSLDEITI